MRPIHLFICLPVALAIVFGFAVMPRSASGEVKLDGKVDFNRDIRPILSENCFACHGNDAKNRKADLRLDHRESAIKDRDGIAAIVPGKPESSEAYLLIASADSRERMPPVKSGKKLSPLQIKLIQRWIKQGAVYGEHWAFVKPIAQPLPPVAQKVWPRNGTDHFILAKLATKGLKPSAPADRYRLIRRVYLDLIGLPPSPKEVDSFVNDKSPDAYEKVVNHLLASPRFGERWAQMWLDLARYADTMGYEKDLPRNIWAYRDWVIDAFNRDLPFDQFTIEQLAGDLLPKARNDQILATAFHRNTLTNQEGGTDDEEYRVLAVKDRVDTTLQVWMGLTMGCAKCHSHKYDPITQAQYYSLYALFNQTEDRDLGSDAPTLATPSPGQRAGREELNSQLAKLQGDVNELVLRHAEDRQSWEASRKNSPQWSVLKSSVVKSTGGTTFEVLPDSSVLASGKSPDRNTYIAETEAPKGQYTAVRLQALTHASLGRQGPGRNGRDPNFVVNEFKLEAQTGKADSPFSQIAFSQAKATFSQKNWSVSGAIDGVAKTGWAVSPQFSKPHTAIFIFETPLELNGKSKLRFRIEQNYGGQLTLGRFRISLSQVDSRTASFESDPIVEIIAKAPNTRSEDDNQKLARAFLQSRSSKDKNAKALLAKITDVESRLNAVSSKAPNTPIMRELPDNRRRETRIHQRGNFLDKGDVVQPGILAGFGPIPVPAPGSGGKQLSRLDVAKWLVHPSNPLTARVQVNRFWARLFGTGLVLTEEDFGNQGSVPSHPELLDYLSVEFVKQGWSVKKLLRSMVISATYRQSSNVTSEQYEKDPDNRWFARAPRFRLEAESVRDQALVAAGLLSSKMFGPSVMPPQPKGVWKITYSGSDWQNATGDDRNRRGLYTFLRRTSPYPSMLTFDAGSREVCLIRRIRTNTPLQSLVTLNDPVFVEAAGGIAKRVMSQGGKTDADRAQFAFRLVAVRLPSVQERLRIEGLFKSALEQFADSPNDAAALLKAAGVSVPQGASSKRLAAWVVVGNLLLNLDEVVTKG